MKYPYNTEDFKQLAAKLESFEHYAVHYPGLTSEAAEVYLKEELFPVFIKFYKEFFT